MHQLLVAEYGKFVHSFLSVSDERIGLKIQEALSKKALWPGALIQLNPAYETAVNPISPVSSS